MKSFKLAYKWFPFERNILIGEADFYSKVQIINKQSYDAVKKALYYDPYSPQLLGLEFQYAFIFGENETVYNSFQLLKKIAPNMPVVKEFIKRGAR